MHQSKRRLGESKKNSSEDGNSSTRDGETEDFINASEEERVPIEGEDTR